MTHTHSTLSEVVQVKRHLLSLLYLLCPSHTHMTSTHDMTTGPLTGLPNLGHSLACGTWVTHWLAEPGSLSGLPNLGHSLACRPGSLTGLPNLGHFLACPPAPPCSQDLNIGAALWLAARGEGRMIRYGGEGEGDGEEEEEVCRAVMGSAEVYRAHARVVFVGTGADEHWPSLESEMRDDVQRLGRRNLGRDDRWPSLESEMRDDVQRLWRRNLGRDDRCLSDHGREPRFPFLDEGVMSALLALPLPRIANLHLPPGTGDKLILRQVRAKIKTNTRD
ncbi:unnamed protein product [Closterium sp. NIES-64]|nr:unnamed protein product [Closterium sp. NIES-64]